MADFVTKALNASTWPDFADLVERNNGVWGGCWCMGFHSEGVGRHKTVEQNRQEKERRVREGRAHAALVYDGAAAVGWCQFGSPEELPRIKHKREYEQGWVARPGGAGLDRAHGDANMSDTGFSDATLPDWRITCFYVDKAYRHRGVTEAALTGALEEIARFGGGTVESYPEDVESRKVSSSFLYNAALKIFERQGFEKIRRLGKNHWVVRKIVAAQD